MEARVSRVYALLSAAALFASGCAFGARHVDLTYAPSLAVRPLPAGAPAVAVVRLTDARSPEQGSGDLLGKVRNGYGMPTASVVANQDPVLWVSEGLARGFGRSGYAVMHTDGAPAGVPTVSGRLLRASGGMYMSMDANVTAEVAVWQQGRQLTTARCEGRATQVAWTASASEYREVFEDAMTRFVDDCMPKLLPALQSPQANP